MTRLHTGTVHRPRYESRPYKPSPARREAIHGRIRPMNDNRRDPTARFFIIGALVIAGFFALQMLRWF
jgi:hypothetical protein